MRTVLSLLLLTYVLAPGLAHPEPDAGVFSATRIADAPLALAPPAIGELVGTRPQGIPPDGPRALAAETPEEDGDRRLHGPSGRYANSVQPGPPSLVRSDAASDPRPVPTGYLKLLESAPTCTAIPPPA